MANEITVIQKDARNRYSLFFLFPISAPRQISSGINLVLYPSTGLPSTISSAFSQAEKDALDNGEAGYTMITLTDTEGLTNPQLLAKARSLYSGAKLRFDANYANFYARTGQRFDYI